MLSSRIVLIVSLASARILSAQSQTPTQPPLGVKRVPPAAPGQTTPKNVPPLLQQYDFGGQLRALDGSGLPSDVKPELLVPGGPTGTAPKDFRPKSDVPLTATALEAVRVSERWQGEKNAPLPGPDGRVMYSFGAGLPTVVCAPLRVCIVELQAGEKIVGEPHIGDSVRWNISPAMYGTGDQATSVIILKPQTPGLDTNLLITTDRRAYYLRLISKPEDYVARVAFAYPEDDTRKWQQQLAAEQAMAKKEKHAAEVPPAMIAVEKVNFDYTIRGGDDPKTGQIYRFNPLTGQSCDGLPQERVVVRQPSAMHSQTVSAAPVREETPEERRAAAAYQREQEAIQAPKRCFAQSYDL